MKLKARKHRKQESDIIFTFISTWTHVLLFLVYVLPRLCFIMNFSSFVLQILLFKYFSDDEINKTRFLDVEGKTNDDNYSCNYGSECSDCSCGYCEDENCRINGNYSICERWVAWIFNGFLEFESKKFQTKASNESSQHKNYFHFISCFKKTLIYFLFIQVLSLSFMLKRQRRVSFRQSVFILSSHKFYWIWDWNEIERRLRKIREFI